MQKIYKMLTVATVLLVTSSCKKYLDINSNPAVPQVVQAELLLPPIEYQMSNGTSQDYLQVWKVTQNMGGVSADVSSRNWEQHTFTAGSDAGGVIWRMTYADLGLNLENMINDAVKNQKYEYAGIGYAIKAWAFQMTTDLYGPIILDEAYTVGQLKFHYQDQPAVYAKVREWGNLAIKYLNMTSPVSYTAALQGTTGDGIYGGDKTKWKKFVYALFALQYSHLRNKAEFATQYADSVNKYVDLSFTSEAEDASVAFNATSPTDSNPLGPSKGYFLTTNTGYYGRPTTTILNYLTGGVRGTAVANSSSSVDPRLTRMLPATPVITKVTGQPDVTSYVYQGITPGLGSSTPGVPLVLGVIPTGSTLYPGRYIFTDKARYPLMTYSQLQFAKAEAMFVKNNKAEAYAAYTRGIRAHMDFYNRYGRTANTPDPAITDAEINAYLGSSEVAKSAVDLNIADIMGQKYIAQWGWAGLETWCDLRKYHYEPTVFRTYYQLTPGELSTNNNGKFAYRFRPRYNSEYVWNLEELAKWGGLDLDYMTKETWFSQNN
jgi:hypothetical protein